MNIISIENLTKKPSPKKKTEKQQLCFLNENCNCSDISRSNSNELSEKQINNLKYYSNNSTIESRKNYDNDIDALENFDNNKLKKGNNNIKNIKNNITLLGKKTKIIFNTIKQTEKKPTFFTIKYRPKKADIIKRNRPKEEIKKVSQKKNLFQTCQYFYLEDSKKKTNEGRWTYEEHIKFIESFVNYGKRWEIIQKYVGTRSREQIRSHSQKFFFRLKALKSDKCGFDFNKNNIESLLDIVNLIAKKNKTNKNTKEFIINTLITLTKLNLENSGKKYLEKKKDNLGTEIKKEEKKNNKISEINYDLSNKMNNNKEIELDEINFDLIKNEDNIPYKQPYSEERDINNNISLELKENNIESNDDNIIIEQNENINKYFNLINSNFNNNYFLFSDESSICSMAQPSLEPNENIFKINNKSPFFKYMM